MADQIVQLREDGKWELIGKDNKKATKLFDTQKEAVEYARSVAANQESGIIVKGRDGKVVMQTASSRGTDGDKKPAKPAEKADAKKSKADEKAAKKKAKEDAKAAKKKEKEDKKKAKKK